MAEFKKLSDVEVIAEPTESANVLIEEDGVIKKAPKTAVGGAGGGSNESVLKIYINDNFEDSSNYTLPDNFYETVLDKFWKEEYPNIFYYLHIYTGDGDYDFCGLPLSVCYDEGSQCVFIYILHESYKYMIKIDSSDTILKITKQTINYS